MPVMGTVRQPKQGFANPVAGPSYSLPPHAPHFQQQQQHAHEDLQDHANIPPPPKKEKKKEKDEQHKKQQKNGHDGNDNGKKRAHGSDDDIIEVTANRSTARGANTASGGINDDDDEEDPEDEADEARKRKRAQQRQFAKQIKKQKLNGGGSGATSPSSARPQSTSSKPLSSGGGPNRLILRLPGQPINPKKSSSSSVSLLKPQKQKKHKHPHPSSRLTPGQPSVLATSSPSRPSRVQSLSSSSELSSVESEEEPLAVQQARVPQRQTPVPQAEQEEYILPDSFDPVYNFGYTSSSEDDGAVDSDDDLADDDKDSDGDDDEDMEDEEKFLIADELRRLSRKRKRSAGRSPNLSTASAHSEELELITRSREQSFGPGEHVLLEITRLHNGTASGNSSRAHAPDGNGATASKDVTVESENEGPVTWSGAEESALDDLDELLGFTADDAAALLGAEAEFTTGSEGRTMRFEEFLAQDDGSDSDSANDEGDDESDDDATEDEDDEELMERADAELLRAVAAAESEGENEHVETTQDVVENGGFIFFQSAYDSASDGESTAEEPLPSEDGGDTTDTLDDSDHVGLVRFGIEAADSDDEYGDNNHAYYSDDVTSTISRRYGSQSLASRDLGLSVSISALAENPQAVIAKTARSLGVSQNIAAKILTSVGMSILMNNAGASIADVQTPVSEISQPGLSVPATAAELPTVVEPSQTITNGTSATPQQQAPSATEQVSAVAEAQQKAGQHPQQTVQLAEHAVQRDAPSDVPILGDFAPSGEADLCVLVAQGDVPAPSPFSVRKKRRPRRFTDGSPSSVQHRRGQSVMSSISSQSMQSAPAGHSNSSEEPSYDIILDLQDLVDTSMLPIGMSGTEEDEDDLDDSASISTALGGGQSLGDVSRWNRIPIGAFRSQGGPTATNLNNYASLATAIFSGTRNPSAVSNLSFHGGVAVTHTPGGRGVSKRKKPSRIIPVSPVLFPTGQTLKHVSSVKSRKEKRHERKQKKIKPKIKPSGTLSTKHHTHVSAESAAATPQQAPSISVTQTPFSPVNLTSPTLPSDGLGQYVSPLFKGMNTGAFAVIPPFSLGEATVQ